MPSPTKEQAARAREKHRQKLLAAEREEHRRICEANRTGFNWDQVNDPMWDL